LSILTLRVRRSTGLTQPNLPASFPYHARVPLADFNKCDQFVEDLGHKVHNLAIDTLKIALTDTAPAATDAVFLPGSAHPPPAAVHGYPSGGAIVGATDFQQVNGIAKLTGEAVVFTAQGGNIGPFQFAILLNATAGGALIGWWAYPEPLTLHDGESFTVGKDIAGDDWDLITPILSLA
jgi:hypothetical protein